MRLKGKVVAITGATAGMGRATALLLGREGAKIGLIARAGLEETSEEMRMQGNIVIACHADVSRFDEVEESAERIENELGPIDVWINNAMTTIFSPFIEITAEEFRRATEVTYLGVVWGTMVALRRMISRDHGTIVQVGSALAYRAIPLQSPYCGAKHAIKGFTDSIRSELFHEKSHVHITMVNLPALNTPQFEWGKSRMPNRAQPVPPIFQPEVAAKGILWAVLNRRRELSVGWPTVKAILGNRFFPGLLDRYLGKVGYNSQQTNEPGISGAPSNLFHPVVELHRTHGRFDEQSKTSSLQFWLTTHRNVIFVLIVIMLMGFLFFLMA